MSLPASVWKLLFTSLESPPFCVDVCCITFYFARSCTSLAKDLWQREWLPERTLATEQELPKVQFWKNQLKLSWNLLLSLWFPTNFTIYIFIFFSFGPSLIIHNYYFFSFFQQFNPKQLIDKTTFLVVIYLTVHCLDIISAQKIPVVLKKRLSIYTYLYFHSF